MPRAVHGLHPLSTVLGIIADGADARARYAGVVGSYDRMLPSWLRRAAQPVLRPYEASVTHVGDIIAHIGDAPHMLRDGIPTELLQSDHVSPIELQGDMSPPGRIVRMQVNRPIFLIASLWVTSILFLALLFAVGELQFSTDEALFINNRETSVQHSTLLQKLVPTDATHDGPWTARRQRRLEADWVAPLPLGAAVQDAAAAAATCPSAQQVDDWFEIVYQARDGGSILRPQHLQEVLVLEQALMEWSHRVGVCSVDIYCRCRPLDSLANYVFPSVLDAGTAGPSLRFDGVTPLHSLYAPCTHRVHPLVV